MSENQFEGTELRPMPHAAQLWKQGQCVAEIESSASPEYTKAEIEEEIARRFNLHERLVKALQRALVNEHSPFEIESMEALLREVKGEK